MLVVISSLISLDASEERCARARTSEATTAKPRPEFAGPRRLDPGVQGQKVGLEGDVVDHADDAGNLFGGPFDPVHRIDGGHDDFAAVLGLVPCVLHDGFHLARAIGGGFDAGGQFVQRGRGFFQRGGLIFGAARQIFRGWEMSSARERIEREAWRTC